MSNREIAITIVVALIASGIWPFFTALLRRRPEVHRIDAEATSITIQGAETTVTVLMRSLERAERREAALEAKLIDRELKIDKLENRLNALSTKLGEVTEQLDDARQQLAAMRR